MAAATEGARIESPRHLATIVAAAAAGTVFEWYDFYIYGSILAIISRQFFGGLNDAAAYVFTLLGFGAGFIVRPLGALVFGRIGDRFGRKRAFLITIAIMGAAPCDVSEMYLPNESSDTSHSRPRVKRKVISSIEGKISGVSAMPSARTTPCAISRTCS